MDTFTLRFVCTANLCRSPLAERIAALRMPAAASAAGWLQVSSAGTQARDGLRMHPPAAGQLTALGADPAGFSSRRLTAALVAESDLVLTAELTQRDAVVALCPAASRRAFVIGEFARLVRHPPVQADIDTPRVVGDTLPATAKEHAAAAREMVARAARYRGRVPWREPALDEIPDPDGSDAAIAACAQEIDLTVTGIVLALARLGAPPTTPSTRALEPRP